MIRAVAMTRRGVVAARLQARVSSALHCSKMRCVFDLTLPNGCSTLDSVEVALAEVRRLSAARLPGAAAGVEGAAAGPGAGEAGPGEAGPGEIAMFPVVPALRELLPRGGLARGSVVAVPDSGLLCLAVAAAASAGGAWCAIAGMPEAGLVAGAGLGMDLERTLLVPDLIGSATTGGRSGSGGAGWPQVVASLLDGCELVLVRPPSRPSAQVRQRLEATLRRARGVLVVAGDWPGAQVRLRVTAQGWTGLGDGFGRLRACCAEVVADGRGEATLAKTRWLWLPAEDGTVTVADPAELPLGLPGEQPGGGHGGLRAAGASHGGPRVAGASHGGLRVAGG
jgi:hypothetical protein